MTHLIEDGLDPLFVSSRSDIMRVIDVKTGEGAQVRTAFDISVPRPRTALARVWLRESMGDRSLSSHWSCSIFDVRVETTKSSGRGVNPRSVRTVCRRCFE